MRLTLPIAAACSRNVAHASLCPTHPLPCSADRHEGTWNNLDSESLREGIVTKQSDVVAFGVMLMDYLFGRPANHGDLVGAWA